jgi:hypothetical protein
MKRQHNGLWYTGSPVLQPTTDHNDNPTNPPIMRPSPSPTIHKTHQTNDSSSMAITNPNVTEATYSNTTTPSVRNMTWTSQALQALRHLELWHQRMGHPAHCTLQRTAQVVHRLPKIPSNYSHLHCPYCDIAKLTKKSGNPTSKQETFIPGTAFHMDLGFIQGPKMIKDDNGISCPSKTQTAQHPHDGYSAYLIIVDAATRYVLWFPLKSRSPPLALIDKFFSKNGHPSRRVISTSPNGLLHQSKVSLTSVKNMATQKMPTKSWTNPLKNS